jgi:hypothetical protein
MAISRPDGLGDIANLGMTLAEAKQLLAQVQQQVVAAICSSEDSERHLEVRVGNVETGTDGRQVFGAVARAETDINCADPADPGNRRPNRHHQGDRFH